MKALAYGEILWDIIGDNAYIGGATFNVAAHLAQFGCESMVLSSLGKDELGDRALAEAIGLGLDPKYIQRDDAHETGKALVHLDEHGVATYDLPYSAYDYIELDDQTIASLKNENFDVIIYGSLASRLSGSPSRKSLERLLNEVDCGIKFYDINIRKNFYTDDLIKFCFEKADVVKINDEESMLVSRIFFGEEFDEDTLTNKLIADCDLKVLIITKGSKGCSVYEKENRYDFPGKKVDVIDTVGAGDSFSAAFLYNYFHNKGAQESAQMGNMLGAYVASRPGAVPQYPDELKTELGLK